MAACCAIAALVIYKLMSIHSHLQNLRETALKKLQPVPGQNDESNFSPTSASSTRCCRLILRGLVCQSCAMTTRDAVLAVPGVHDATVSLHTLTARIYYDTRRTNPYQLVSEIEKVGYGVEELLLEDDWRSQWLSASKARRDKLEDLHLTFKQSTMLSAAVFIVESVESWLSLEATTFQQAIVVTKLVVGFFSIIWLACPMHREALSALRRGRANSASLSSMGVLSTFAAAVHHGSTDYLFQGQSGGARFSMISACMLASVVMGGKLIKSTLSQRSTSYPELLASATPETARLLAKSRDAPRTDCEAKNISVGLLDPGNIIAVAAKAPFPADCKVIEGHSSVLESIIRGETAPRAVGPGDRVFAGSTNCEATVIVEVLRVGKQTWLGQALQAVTQASETKSDSEIFSEWLLSRFSSVVLSFAISLGIYHSLRGSPTATALNRVGALLLCACPCTLGIGIPICIMAAMSNAYSAGIVLRPGPHIERSRNAHVIVFDKTGTLTKGTMQLGEVFLEEEWRKTAKRIAIFWQIVGSLASQSQHPVSALLVQESIKQADCVQLQTTKESLVLQSYKEHPGLGLTGVFTHHEETFNVSVGNNRLMQTQNIYFAAASMPLSADGAHMPGTVYASINGQLACRITFSDSVVPSAKDLITSLRSLNYQTYMMTGDTRAGAQTVAAHIGIAPENVYHSLLPHDKAELIDRLEQQQGPVIMIGDNLNDAPALAAATVGIVVSSYQNEIDMSRKYCGRDMVPLLHEEADVLLLPLADNVSKIAKTGVSTSHPDYTRGLQRILYILGLLKETNRRIRNVLTWSLLYNVVALSLASGLWAEFAPVKVAPWFDLSPASASIFMSLSSIVTLGYCLSLENWRPEQGR